MEMEVDFSGKSRSFFQIVMDTFPFSGLSSITFARFFAGLGELMMFRLVFVLGKRYIFAYSPGSLTSSSEHLNKL